MAEIFRSGRVRREGCLVAFLIVGPDELCEKISEGLYANAGERKWNISVHQCESISDVITTRMDISVDYIIFTFNPRISNTLLEIEANIAKIDEHYILSGAVCLVNCHGISNTILIHQSRKLCQKYNIRFLTANVSKKEACISLGDRILNVAEAILGLTSGIPVIGTVMQFN